jgi:hypothetical protein
MNILEDLPNTLCKKKGIRAAPVAKQRVPIEKLRVRKKAIPKKKQAIIPKLEE